MPCCVNTVLKVCESASTCEGSILYVPGADLPSGNYDMRFNFLGFKKVIPVSVVDGTLTIPTDGLNEDFTYVSTLIDLNTNFQVAFNSQYDAIQFTTKQSI